ncbi:hypothetical protein Z517_08932 [Fonsecaea pedrosoi CBS 271.37]|uniref:SnoaL-like domain-containing protein n=1 Tax=Fonsecaea pedrosoi CBS 271.37 TaxID=1442368 RepID=A0A0D2EY38_9EURO|nr:uncharacterized protein Z517_08932 [Fonsecaea pedrosoi CBS 271.37]KIW79092.1 hypothetical protein Z517_08932 [Fonsecaea pedrosoi CBS 271.37]
MASADSVSADVAHTLAYANLLDVFSNRNRESRRRAIQETYHADVTFYEPDSVTTGHDGVDSKCEELLSARKGWGFVPVGNVQRNHGMVYLAWGFGPRDTATGEVEAKVKGADVLMVEEGKIRKFWVIIEGVTDSKSS